MPSMPVKLRNLSAEGALVEADKLPVEGTAILFRKGDLSVPGRVAQLAQLHQHPDLVGHEGA